MGIRYSRRGLLSLRMALTGFLAVACLTVASLASASHCTSWEKLCDKDGFCIQNCVDWRLHEPFNVKPSGETAARGKISPSKEEEIESKESLSKELKVE